MTSVSPYPEEMRLAQRRSSVNGRTTTTTMRPLSELSEPYKRGYVQEMQPNDSYENAALPWNTKDPKGEKNFYESYAKENDRRKKEGNGFLMLLPGIAIPIDTDAGESDEDASEASN